MEDDGMRSKIISKISKVSGRKELAARAEELVMQQHFANSVEGQVLMPTGAPKQKHSKTREESFESESSESEISDESEGTT